MSAQVPLKPSWTARIFYIVGCYFLWRGSFGQQNYFFDAGELVLYIVLGTPFLLIGTLIHSKRTAEHQKRMDASAADMIRHAQSITDGRWTGAVDGILYLRPFVFTNAFRSNVPDTSNVFHLSNLVDGSRWDLEYDIALALDGSWPFVGLGEPGEHVGAGRAKSTEDDWREKIKSCIKTFKGIIIVPSFQEGTLWEVGEILEYNALEKTVFLLPPTEYYSTKIDLPTYWAKTRQAFREAYQIDLPALDEDDRRGFWFKIGTDRVMTSKRKFLLGPAAIRSALKEQLGL